jgi:curved DNA-binding protein CbpA
LSGDATDDEIKKQYRILSILVHPDRNRTDARAKEAFYILEQAHKTLMD